MIPVDVQLYIPWAVRCSEETECKKDEWILDFVSDPVVRVDVPIKFSPHPMLKKYVTLFNMIDLLLLPERSKAIELGRKYSDNIFSVDVTVICNTFPRQK